MPYVRWFDSLGSNDVGIVGGKNASLGEMIVALKEVGIRVPEGFATMAAAYWKFLEANDLKGKIESLEFIINNIIKVHPMALVKFQDLQDAKVRRQIEDLTQGYDEKTDYFVEHLARGIAKIAASQHPDPVIVRMSDFKTNEYANLIGGGQFEPKEDNPMLGFRGASRYYSDRYREGFALECQAIRMVREEIGMTNVIVMIPFCRTLKEADRVLATMADYGLKRGENGLKIYVMAEIPANIILADDHALMREGIRPATSVPPLFTPQPKSRGIS